MSCSFTRRRPSRAKARTSSRSLGSTWPCACRIFIRPETVRRTALRSRALRCEPEREVAVDHATECVPRYGPTPSRFPPRSGATTSSNQQKWRFRRLSADFLPAARAASRIAGEVPWQRRQTKLSGRSTAYGQRFCPHDVHATSHVDGIAWMVQRQVGQLRTVRAVAVRAVRDAAERAFSADGVTRERTS